MLRLSSALEIGEVELCGKLWCLYVRLSAFNQRAVQIPRFMPHTLRLRLHPSLVSVRALPFFSKGAGIVNPLFVDGQLLKSPDG